LLAHGWWLSLGIPASFTTTIGRHDIAEILLKVALKHKNQSNLFFSHTKNLNLRKNNFLIYCNILRNLSDLAIVGHKAPVNKLQIIWALKQS